MGKKYINRALHGYFIAKKQYLCAQFQVLIGKKDN